MAGETLIGGTGYGITAGKALIGGTDYNITAGKTLIGGTAEDITLAGLKVEDVFNASAISSILYSSITGSNPTWKRDVSFSTAGTYYHFYVRANSTTEYWWKISEVSSDGTTATINRYWESSSSTTATTYTVSGNTVSAPSGGVGGAVFALKFTFDTAKLRKFFTELTSAISIKAGKSSTSAGGSSVSPFTGYSFTHGSNYAASSSSGTTYTTYFGVADVTSSGTITSIWGFGFKSNNKSGVTTNSSVTLSNQSLLRYASNNFRIATSTSSDYSCRYSSIWSADL